MPFFTPPPPLPFFVRILFGVLSSLRSVPTPHFPPPLSGFSRLARAPSSESQKHYDACAPPLLFSHILFCQPYPAAHPPSPRPPSLGVTPRKHTACNDQPYARLQQTPAWTKTKRDRESDERQTRDARRATDARRARAMDNRTSRRAPAPPPPPRRARPRRPSNLSRITRPACSPTPAATASPGPRRAPRRASPRQTARATVCP